MNADNSGFINLYVDSDLSDEALARTLANGFETLNRLDNTAFLTDNMFVGVESNGGIKYPNDQVDDPSSAFLYYRQVVVLEESEQSEVDVEIKIQLVKKVVSLLRQEGCKVVAACDFEEQIDDDYVAFRK